MTCFYSSLFTDVDEVKRSEHSKEKLTYWAKMPEFPAVMR